MEETLQTFPNIYYRTLLQIPRVSIASVKPTSQVLASAMFLLLGCGTLQVRYWCRPPDLMRLSQLVRTLK
jgi:hypothetical protein